MTPALARHHDVSALRSVSRGMISHNTLAASDDLTAVLTATSRTLMDGAGSNWCFGWAKQALGSLGKAAESLAVRYRHISHVSLGKKLLRQMLIGKCY